MTKQAIRCALGAIRTSSAVGAMLAATLLIGAAGAEGAISGIHPGPGDGGTPLQSQVPVQQGRTMDWYVNGHGVDFAKSVSISGSGVSVSIAGRKNGFQNNYRGTPMGQLQLRFATNGTAAVGLRNVTITYPLGQDQFTVRVISNGTITAINAATPVIANGTATLTLNGSGFNHPIVFVLPQGCTSSVLSRSQTQAQLSVKCTSAGSKIVRVRDENVFNADLYWTSSRSFTVVADDLPASLAAVTLTAPGGNTTFNLRATTGCGPTFQWSQVANATRYEIFVLNARTKSSRFWEQAANSRQLPVNLLAGDNYEWKVRPIAVSSATGARRLGPYSSVRTLHVRQSDSAPLTGNCGPAF